MTRPLLNDKVFGRLRVLERSANTAQGRVCWRCQCECGNVTVVDGTSLRLGRTRSCGCLRDEVDRSIDMRTKTLAYSSWNQMTQRCNNPKRSTYAYYGGRGIKVCERWAVFENFLADMGERPSRKHSIERDDNDGNYEPDNCRWATMKEQTQNRRNSVKLTFNGCTKTISAWAEHLGIHRETISTRHKAGWPVEYVLSTVKQPSVKFQGVR